MPGFFLVQNWHSKKIASEPVCSTYFQGRRTTLKGDTMKFIIAIEPGTQTSAWGVAVPDLPGCFSAGDSLDEAMDNARQAIDQHVEIMIEDGAPIPRARSLAVLQSDAAYAGWVWAV